jgi:hypothetical protein
VLFDHHQMLEMYWEILARKNFSPRMHLPAHHTKNTGTGSDVNSLVQYVIIQTLSEKLLQIMKPVLSPK